MRCFTVWGYSIIKSYLDKPIRSHVIESEIIIQKLDRKTKEKARLYYFANYSLGDIASICNIEIDTVRFFVFGESGSGSNENCWFQLKKKLDPASVAAYVHDKISVLDKTAGVALNLVAENLKRIQQEMIDDPTKVMSLDDTRKLASIVVDMDKMVRLESGQATQIVENIGLSRAEALRILADDPFANAIEVDEEDIHYVTPEEIIKGDVEIEAPWKS